LSQLIAFAEQVFFFLEFRNRDDHTWGSLEGHISGYLGPLPMYWAGSWKIPTFHADRRNFISPQAVSHGWCCPAASLRDKLFLPHKELKCAQQRSQKIRDGCRFKKTTTFRPGFRKQEPFPLLCIDVAAIEIDLVAGRQHIVSN